jgi:hypothetical protein
MPFNNALMVLSANAQRAAMTHMQLHTGDPGAAGTANVTSAARQAVTWSAATSDGDYGLASAVNFTGVAANGAATWVSLWSAITSGTTYGNFALSGDATANAAGEYTVTALNLNGSAT